MTVSRFVSLTKLIPSLLALVDAEKLSVSTASDYISDLPQNEQTDLYTVMERIGVIPGRTQLVKIKQYSKDGTLTATVIDAILSEARPAPVQVTLKRDRLRYYFPESYSSQQMEEVIFSLLETWKSNCKEE